MTSIAKDMLKQIENAIRMVAIVDVIANTMWNTKDVKLK